MYEPPLLLADIGEIIQVVIVLIVIISSIVGHLFSKANANKQGPRPQPQNHPQPHPPQPLARGPVGAGNPGRQQNDIERFLQDVSRRIRQEQAPEMLMPAQEPIAAIPVPDASSPLGGSRFEQPLPSLSSPIEQADETFENRLNQEFEHPVGQLYDSTYGMEDLPVAEGTDAAVWTDRSAASGQSAERGSSLAGEIAAMLRDPRNVRRAVVLSEILNAPRWNQG